MGFLWGGRQPEIRSRAEARQASADWLTLLPPVHYSLCTGDLSGSEAMEWRWDVQEVTGPDWLSRRDCHPQRGAETFLGQKLRKLSLGIRTFLSQVNRSGLSKEQAGRGFNDTWEGWDLGEATEVPGVQDLGARFKSHTPFTSLASYLSCLILILALIPEAFCL